MIIEEQNKFIEQLYDVVTDDYYNLKEQHSEIFKFLEANYHKAASFQLCPKCNGQGSVSKPSYVPGDVHHWSSTSATHLCDVCNGQKILTNPGISR